MIAMAPDAGGIYETSSAPAPVDYSGPYAPEGHADNSVSLVASPTPPVLQPTSGGAQLVSTLSALAPTTVSPVLATLTNVVQSASTGTSDVSGMLYAGSYQPNQSSTSPLASPSVYTPVPSSSTTGAGVTNMPGPVVPTISDLGAGLVASLMPGSAPSSKNGSRAQQTATPAVSSRTWLLIGAAVLAFVVLR